jgi:ATP-dependent 26S proteasome regulatory subunit
MNLQHPYESQEAAIVATPFLSTMEQIRTIAQPLLIFSGSDRAAQRATAQVLAARLNRPLLTVDMAGVAAQGMNARRALSLALRDARLTQAIAYFHGWDVCLAEQSTPIFLLETLFAHPDIVIVAGKTPWRAEGVTRQRAVLRLEFPFPDYGQRKGLWQYYIQTAAENIGQVDTVALAGQFTLTTEQIRDATASARDRAVQRGEPLQQADLFAAARAHSSPRLSDMARKIEPRYDWRDIILPNDQLQILRELVSTVRMRPMVLEEWELGKKLVSSAGLMVLFAGPPGTGKTMAAEVIARDLGLDLYKIDLSNLVSKYIGETEKNLEHIFSEAQSSNAILFFDEADAVFGKRASVKDARDRYANIEVSYLLQRMESYDGVTILATNLRSNIDDAFSRRIQFAIDIPFPDERDRLRIWQTLLPTNIPLAPDVNLEEMARRFKLAGGNIRNIIVSAVYLAAAEGGVITMKHLLHGARRELQKMGRLLPEG